MLLALRIRCQLIGSRGRTRWFWMLQAAGWALWFSDQVVWITFDLILHKKLPGMYPADALLFLAGAPMMAGLLLRPHRQAPNAARVLEHWTFFSCFSGGCISTYHS